ncbi:MAG: SET domain-containing protein [Opitutae bacterium]|nr:SET domain-containing protein [Opitutae bacterium]MDG1300034.1 SET domain-containing protein [Opitutae bacterium]
MVLPSLRIQWLSDEKGYGLIATEFVPKGTITYCQDSLDIVIPQGDISKYSGVLRDSIYKFAYEPPTGEMVLGWDHAKYINHCCLANTLSTGYEFEIAVRDIEVGEELTTDYRLFSKHNTFHVVCRNEHCPQSAMDALPLKDIDARIQSALSSYSSVEQPLGFLVATDTLERLNAYLNDSGEYISVEEELPKT